MSHLTYQGQRVNLSSYKVDNNGETYIFYFVDRTGIPRRMVVPKPQIPQYFFSKNEIAKQKAIQELLVIHELESFLLG